MPDLRNEVSQLEVKGFNETLGRSIEVDVLSDRFMVSKPMVRQDTQSRAVTQDSAYAAISEAYEELRNDLVQAAALRR
jgi:hypothetical protein